MTLKKYITYQCDTCKRTKDLPTDKLHGFINLCTITQNCKGRLKPIATKNLREILPSSVSSSLSNWKPRTSINSGESPAISNEEVIYFNAASSTSKILTLAVKGIPASLPSVVDIKFSIEKAESQSYIEYTYTLAANSDTIIGTDNSSYGKMLRFFVTDVVMVYVNGVLLLETDYVLNFQGTNGYSVTINQKKKVQSAVKVVVFQNVPIAETTPIIFTKNSELDINSAWENVTSVTINSDVWTLYSCLDLSELPVNTILTLYQGATFSNALNLTELTNVNLLLAYDPFTPIDRINSCLVSFDKLSAENQHLRIYSHNGSNQVQITNHTLDLSLSIRITTVKDPMNELVNTLSQASIDPVLLPSNLTVIGPI